MKSEIRKFLTWSAVFFTAGCWAYSLAARYTDIFFASKKDKIAIIGSLLIVSCLFSAWIFLVLLKPLIRTISKKPAVLSLGMGLLIVALTFSIIYKPPPFPEQHNLTITVTGKKNPLSEGSKVEVISLKTVSLPTRIYKRVPINQLWPEGNWHLTNEGFGILIINDQNFSASFDRFMQAGISIEFLTGPQEGITQLAWDGVEFTLDLYSLEPGYYSLEMSPALDWRNADLTRKILVAITFVSDFLGISVLVTVISLLIYHLFSVQKIKIRQPGLVLLCFALIVGLQFAVLKINKEVVFDNANLEAAIRETIKKQDGGIYQRQLLTLVKLDASGRKLTSLNGIEQLPNLIQLNLRDNEISDLAPLRKLRFLQKLNLRSNAVKDLSPLAQMTSLTYLNIHSNSDIGSIEPLKNLINLNTVIMEDVPIRDQMQVLAGLQQLRYLNMRYCGVKDLTPIAQLAGLEYLNLYSNPEIPSIKPLQSLGNLKTLILGNIPIGNELDTLENLTKLTYLNLRNTDLTDISPLARLVNLEYLNLHSNPEIKSILPLQSLTNLQTLILRNVPVGKQIEIMGSFPNLRKLNLQNSGITDIGVLSDLMARGILQDNPKQSVQASVDISDNPIPRGPSDLYADLRPFWENITERQPLNLPFYAALRAPDFSKQAGFYEESFLLELSTDEPGASIYYTLDGSEPTELSTVYTDPILIASRRGEPDVYSAIEAIASDWEAPDEEVYKSFIVRAKIINRFSGLFSATITHTYFVDRNIKHRYSLPIVSLVTDPKNFFDE